MVLIDDNYKKSWGHPNLSLMMKDDEPMEVKEWIKKYRGNLRFETIMEIVLREEFFFEKNIRRFGLHCIKDALNYVDKLDEKLYNVYHLTEKYCNDEVTEIELYNGWCSIANKFELKFMPITTSISTAIKCISHPNVSWTSLAVINARDIIWKNCNGMRSATNDFYNFLIENVEALK